LGLRLVLPLLIAHLAGTFLTFVMLPELMFRDHDPLMLTASGEFVMKNLVLIAAAMVLICHTGRGGVPPADASTGSTRWTQRRVVASDASSNEPQPVSQRTA
jgi:hypothetical protein